MTMNGCCDGQESMCSVDFVFQSLDYSLTTRLQRSGGWMAKDREQNNIIKKKKEGVVPLVCMLYQQARAETLSIFSPRM